MKKQFFTMYLPISGTVGIGLCYHTVYGLGKIKAISVMGYVEWDSLFLFDDTRPNPKRHMISQNMMVKVDEFMPVKMFMLTDDIKPGDRIIIPPTELGMKWPTYPNSEFVISEEDFIKYKIHDFKFYKVIGEIFSSVVNHIKDWTYFSEDDIQVNRKVYDKRTKHVEVGDRVYASNGYEMDQYEGTVVAIKPLIEGEGNWEDIYQLEKVINLKDNTSSPDINVERKNMRFKPIPYNEVNIRCSFGCFH